MASTCTGKSTPSAMLGAVSLFPSLPSKATCSPGGACGDVLARTADLRCLRSHLAIFVVEGAAAAHMTQGIEMAVGVPVDIHGQRVCRELQTCWPAGIMPRGGQVDPRWCHVAAVVEFSEVGRVYSIQCAHEASPPVESSNTSSTWLHRRGDRQSWTVEPAQSIVIPPVDNAAECFRL